MLGDRASSGPISVSVISEFCGRSDVGRSFGSCDISVGHESGLSCGFHCHRGYLGRAAYGRTPRASRALRVASR